MTKLKEKICVALNSRGHIRLKEVASIVGLLQSCARALGPVVRIMTRTCYGWLKKNLERVSWNGYAAFPGNCREELSFWIDNIEILNGFLFSSRKEELQFQYELCGDASQKGLFCFQYSSSEEVVLRRLLTSDEKKKSSTFREMLVLHEVYAKSSIEKYSGLVLRHLVDNQAVMWIMSVGSRNPELQIMVKEIFLNCRKWDVRLVVEWRSRDDPLLKIADVGSKDFDDSCYSLDFESFSALMDFFSHLRLDVDAMAHDWNKKCENFFSRLYDSRALGINFFAQKLDMASSWYRQVAE